MTDTWEAVATCSSLGTVVVAAASAATALAGIGAGIGATASAATVLAGIAAAASAATVLAGIAAAASAATVLAGIAAAASAATVLAGIGATASAAAVLVGIGATASAATALAGIAATAFAATVIAGTGATSSAAAVLVGFAGAELLFLELSLELSLEFTAFAGMPTVSQGGCSGALVDSCCCLCGAWVGTGMVEGLGLATMATWDAAAGLGSSCLQGGFASIFGTAGGPANAAVGAPLGTGGACICGGMAAALQGVAETGVGEMGSGLAGQLLFIQCCGAWHCRGSCFGLHAKPRQFTNWHPNHELAVSMLGVAFCDQLMQRCSKLLVKIQLLKINEAVPFMGHQTFILLRPLLHWLAFGIVLGHARGVLRLLLVCQATGKRRWAGR